MCNGILFSVSYLKSIVLPLNEKNYLLSLQKNNKPLNSGKHEKSDK